MASTEWWVMRVEVARGCVVSEQQRLDVERGVLCVVNDEVCRPVECFEGRDAQEKAIKLMGVLGAKFPRATYKTVLSTNDL